MTDELEKSLTLIAAMPPAQKVAAVGLPEPVDLQHMALSEEGTLRWMSGRKVSDCELYAMPDFGRAPPLVRLDAVEPLVAGLRAEVAALLDENRLMENSNATLGKQYILDRHEKSELRKQNAELEKALKYAVSQVPELGTVPGIHAALSAYEGREGE